MSKIPLFLQISCYMDLPFFPKYQTVKADFDCISVTWFEPKFSQNHYNDKNMSKGSNACTLIAIIMAATCKNEDLIIYGPECNINLRMVYLLAYSILEGNKIHETLTNKGVLKHVNLNVPEAIKYADYRVAGIVEWKSMIYMEPLLLTLYKNLYTNFVQWRKTQCKKFVYDLYVILIAAGRSVLFIFQEDTNTVEFLDFRRPIHL